MGTCQAVYTVRSNYNMATLSESLKIHNLWLTHKAELHEDISKSESGGWCNTNMWSCQYRNSHYKDETVTVSSLQWESQYW